MFRWLEKIKWFGVDHGYHKYLRAKETKSLINIMGVAKEDALKAIEIVDKVSTVAEDIQMIIKNDGKRSSKEIADILFKKHDIILNSPALDIVESMIEIVDITDGKVSLGDIKRKFLTTEGKRKLLRIGLSYLEKYLPLILETILSIKLNIKK